MKDNIDSLFLFSSIMLIFIGVGGFILQLPPIIYKVVFGYYAVLASVWLTLQMRKK